MWNPPRVFADDARGWQCPFALETRPDSPGEPGMQPRDPCLPWRRKPRSKKGKEGDTRTPQEEKTKLSPGDLPWYVLIPFCTHSFASPILKLPPVRQNYFVFLPQVSMHSTYLLIKTSHTFHFSNQELTFILAFDIAHSLPPPAHIHLDHWTSVY